MSQTPITDERVEFVMGQMKNDRFTNDHAQYVMDVMTNLSRHLEKEHKSVSVQVATLRARLWRKEVGHPEHHPSWGCSACKKLRQELDDEFNRVTEGLKT